MTRIDAPEALTNERGTTHGDWMIQSDLALQLKNQMRSGPNWFTMPPYKREALDMIAVKISRILSGDPAAEDHWDDIAGYAFLGKKGHVK